MKQFFSGQALVNPNPQCSEPIGVETARTIAEFAQNARSVADLINRMTPEALEVVREMKPGFFGS